MNEWFKNRYRSLSENHNDQQSNRRRTNKNKDNDLYDQQALHVDDNSNAEYEYGENGGNVGNGESGENGQTISSKMIVGDVIVFIWILLSLCAFVHSIHNCVDETVTGSVTQKLVGFFMSLLIGPFYWIYVFVLQYKGYLVSQVTP